MPRVAPRIPHQRADRKEIPIMTRALRAGWFALSGVAGLIVLLWLNTHDAPYLIQGLCGASMGPAFAAAYLMARGEL